MQETGSQERAARAATNRKSIYAKWCLHVADKFEGTTKNPQQQQQIRKPKCSREHEWDQASTDYK